MILHFVQNDRLFIPAELGHVVDQVLVRLELVHVLLHPGHGFDGVHVGKELAEDPDAVDRVRVIQQVVAAGGGENEVDGREDALVGQVAVQLQFHVAGTLAFLHPPRRPAV